MGKVLRKFLLVLAFLGIQLAGFGQFTSEYPPEPTTAEGPLRTGCGEGGTDGSIPPPVGLCLPVNDYLLPLFFSGMALGSFFLFDLQKKQEFKNSVP